MKVRGFMKKQGFTLLELLVAIALFGLVVGLVFGIYNSVISVVTNVEQTTAFNDRARIVFEQMQRDINGLYKGRSGYLRAVNSEDAGTDSFLQFTSSAHLSFNSSLPPVSMARIGYQLRSSGKDFVLYRSDSPFQFGAQNGAEDLNLDRNLVLCEHVLEFKIRYIDYFGRELESWEARPASGKDRIDDRLFPVLIRVEIVLGDGSGKNSEKRTYISSINVSPSFLSDQPENGNG